MKTRLSKNQREQQQQALDINGLSYSFAPDRDLVERLAREVREQRELIRSQRNLLDYCSSKSLWWLILNRRRIMSPEYLRVTSTSKPGGLN